MARAASATDPRSSRLLTQVKVTNALQSNHLVTLATAEPGAAQLIRKANINSRRTS